MTLHRLIWPFIFLGIVLSLPGLPVPLGNLAIGLEGFDGYQEGMAAISTDESGTTLEIQIAYRGFGLDSISYTFPREAMRSVSTTLTDAAWWRSRLLEMDVEQTVIRDTPPIMPKLVYAHRGHTYPFESIEHTLQFVRQGRDYALLLTEISPGADTRKSKEKTLPVFTIHIIGREIPYFRDIISEDNLSYVLAEYAAEKAAIETILSSSPQ